jgi:uncharacterized protein (DUF4415 family)
MPVENETVVFDDDNPEWTEEDFARAKRGDAIPAHIREAFGKSSRGRPAGSTKPNSKKSVTLRLDPDVIEGWRASGPGWQRRMNDALRAAMLR